MNIHSNGIRGRAAPPATTREAMEFLKDFTGGVKELASTVNLLKSTWDGRKRAGRSFEESVRLVGRWVQAEVGSDEARSWCLARGLSVHRAQGGGVNSLGGALVPSDEIATIVLALVDAYGVFRDAANRSKMRGDRKITSRRTANLTANIVAEGASIPETSMTGDLIELNAKKNAIRTKISAELFEDAAFDVGLLFLQAISNALAFKEDDCGFNGNGTQTYGGIIGLLPRIIDGSHGAANVAAASGHNTYLSLDATDLSNLVGAVQGYAVPGAQWFISQRGYALTLCRLAAVAGGITRDANGNPIFMGFPVKLVQVMSQSTSSLIGSVMIAFGDLGLAATFGDRRDLRLRFSTDRYFETDEVGILGSARFDINIHDLGDASTPGPVAGLVGSA